MYIRRSKHGTRVYHYLVESYRDGGKVKTRIIKYLGRKVPPEYMKYLYKGQLPLE